MRNVAIIMYRVCPSFLFVSSENDRCFHFKVRRNLDSVSWNSPKGQSQPQKARPKRREATISEPITIPIFSIPKVEYVTSYPRG